MGKITAIKKLKHLYRIDLEKLDEEKIFVCEDTIVHFIMTIDKEITDNELTEIIDFDQFARGKSLAIYYLSFKPRTEHEVRRYLIEHDILEDKINRILSALTENNLINDKVYAENFIQGKISMANSGPYQIKQKLILKGIDKRIIEQVLDDIYTEEIQIDIAYKIAEKQTRTHSQRLTLKQLKQKIIQSLTSKGFTYSVSNIALDSLELEVDEKNELDLLNNEINKIAHRYSKNYDGYERTKKIAQALARKGFDFDDIYSALKNYDFDI